MPDYNNLGFGNDRLNLHELSAVLFIAERIKKKRPKVMNVSVGFNSTSTSVTFYIFNELIEVMFHHEMCLVEDDPAAVLNSILHDMKDLENI